MNELYFDTRFALGEYDALEAELTTQTKSSLDLAAHLALLRVLVANGKVDAAKAQQARFAQRASAEGASPQLALFGQFLLKYLTGDMAEALASAESLQADGYGSQNVFGVQLELGRPEGATALVESEEGMATATNALLLSLAWQKAGNRGKATEWRKNALKTLREGSSDDRRVADLLEKGAAVTMDDVDDLALPRRDMALLLVVLADQSSELRQPLLERAEKLNLLEGFPYHFLKGLIAEKKSGSAESL